MPELSSRKFTRQTRIDKVLCECARIDECKDWADKMAALASYAKQAKNEKMLKDCMRIQARAIRRCGELLRTFNNERARTDLDDGAATQRRVAEDAGLSERQRVTAVRVANVPEDDFESAVESEEPPTVTALAEQGKTPKPLIDLHGIPPEDYARATEARGHLRRLAEFGQVHEPARIAKAFMPHEIRDLRAWVAMVDHWLDRFIVNLPE